MNSRERSLLSLNHKEPDRVPFDLGGTVLTSISIHSYRKLRDYLGLPEREIRVMDIFQQIAEIDDDVRQKLGCDIRNVAPRSSATFRIDINYDRNARLRILLRRVGYRLAHAQGGRLLLRYVPSSALAKRPASTTSRSSRGQTQLIRAVSRACANAPATSTKT